MMCLKVEQAALGCQQGGGLRGEKPELEVPRVEVLYAAPRDSGPAGRAWGGYMKKSGLVS